MPAKGGGQAVLYIVDRDPSVRTALCRLALSGGLEARSFESVDQFVALPWRQGSACVILDSSQLVDGSKLRNEMRRRGIDWPVIVLCDGDGKRARHDARAAGARFLLNKPVDAQALLDTIAWITEG